MQKKNIKNKSLLNIFSINKLYPFLLIIFLYIYLFHFTACLYSFEKQNLESNNLDSMISKLKENEKSIAYPDKNLLKLLQAILLERKQDYILAYEIYQTLINSEYSIYAKNRINIILKYYINPHEIQSKTQNQLEESIFTKYENNLLTFLSYDDIKTFFNLFYSLIFPVKKSSREELTHILGKIRKDEKLQSKIFELLTQSETILNQNNLAYMTKSKIYFYRFFFYLFSATDYQDLKDKKSNSLYLSFFNGGLYYYQILSYCIINAISSDDLLKSALDVEFSKLDLANFFEFTEDLQKEFFNLIKDKKEIRKNLKRTFNQSKIKKTEYDKDKIQSHLFLANYLFENDLNIEFSRAIFYLRDLVENYRIYNSLLIDFYNYTGQYDKAIYYQWDNLLNNFFPISILKREKISAQELVCIFPLWFIDIINENIEKFKDQFEPLSSKDSILLDPYLYLAIINAESSFSKEIFSVANAIGLMQLLPSTDAWLRRSTISKSKENLKNPAYNIESGFYYIKYLNKFFNGNIIYILGAYNSGHNSFNKKKTPSIHPLLVSELYPVSETSIYIKKIIRNYLFYKLIYE
ncbi:MAG: lytic transglycosylase domain-containing protein, partial [Exilispira sp.]